MAISRWNCPRPIQHFCNIYSLAINSLIDTNDVNYDEPPNVAPTDHQYSASCVHANPKILGNSMLSRTAGALLLLYQLIAQISEHTYPARKWNLLCSPCEPYQNQKCCNSLFWAHGETLWAWALSRDLIRSGWEAKKPEYRAAFRVVLQQVV